MRSTLLPLPSVPSLRFPPLLFFSFNHTAPPEIYTLSLHDALPISSPHPMAIRFDRFVGPPAPPLFVHLGDHCVASIAGRDCSRIVSGMPAANAVLRLDSDKLFLQIGRAHV